MKIKSKKEKLHKLDLTSSRISSYTIQELGRFGLKMSKQLLSDKEFNELLRQQTSFVTSMLKTLKQKAFFPTLVVISVKDTDGVRNVTHSLLPMLPVEPEKKASIMEEMGKETFVKKLQPIACFFISEAWKKVFKKGEEATKAVKEYKNKEEIIIVAGKTIDGRENTATINIKKGWKKYLKPGKVEEIESDGTAQNGNILLESFYRGYRKPILTSLGDDMKRANLRKPTPEEIN